MTSTKAHRHLFSLTLSAVATALGVALAYLPHAISLGSAARLDLAILPILLLAVWVAPPYTGAALAAVDLLSCLTVGDEIYLPITLVKLVLGLLMGLFLYRRPVKPLRGSLVFLFLALTVDFGLMTMALYPLFGSFFAVITARAVSVPVNLLLRIAFYLLLVPRVTRIARPYLVRNGLLPKEESK
ncbi:MAG: hypothetical protein IJW71_01610 [Clostridia bacterium]|nr:hypothetical protein [Clostridia bacterium]